MTNLKNISTYPLILLLTLMTIISCNSDEAVNEVPVTKSSTVIINGTSFQTVNESIGGNTNCNSIYVSTSFQGVDDIRFNLRFEFLKNGELKRVWYDEILLSPGSSNVAQIFLTPNFNPISTFSIENFVYNESENSVAFDFEGTVFLENNVNTFREISGRLENTDLEITDCNNINYSMDFTGDAFQFHTVNYLAIKYSTDEQQHRYLSNNGFMMEIKTDNDLWDFENTTYTFDENSANRINIFRYSGPLAADQIQSVLTENWQLYSSRGTFTVDEKVISQNGFKIVSGKINIEILLDDEVLYTVSDIQYTATSFSN